MKVGLEAVIVIAIVFLVRFTLRHRSNNELLRNMYLFMAIYRMPQDAQNKFNQLLKTVLDKKADVFWVSELSKVPLDRLAQKIDEQCGMSPMEFGEYLRGLKTFRSMMRVLLRSFLPLRKRRREILAGQTS